MEVSNCTSINGVILNEVKFNLDGTVVGIIDSNGAETKLSYECCVANNWTFDSNYARCYWSTTCVTGGTYNIVLDPEGNAGALFQIDPDQTDLCQLELEFDWLLKFDCGNLNLTLKQMLESLDLTVKIEKVIFNENLPIANNLETVASKKMFNIDSVLTYFQGNTNTGILIKGGTTSCNNLRQTLINDLGGDASIITNTSLDSDWVNFKLVIDDPDVLNSISNERLKVSIQGNKLNNFSILLDDVKLNRVCDVPTPDPIADEECPKFELNRFVDNKKSWVENSTVVVRDFDLERRTTRYAINNEKLSINTKEVDIAINPAQAVDDDVFTTIVDNVCLLEPATGATSATTDHTSVDLTELLTVPLIELQDNDDLLSIFINARNRKTLSGYPTIDLIYHRYNNAFEHCGVTVNPLSSDTLDDFVGLIGSYWSDLIEQLVPATTIWTSILTSGGGGNLFTGAAENKFKYRKYSTIACLGRPTYSAPSPVSGVTYMGLSENTATSTLAIDVSVQDITDTVTNDLVENCSEITTIQLTDSSEFIGAVTVIGAGEGPTDGSIISLSETIDDDCDEYGNCD